VQREAVVAALGDDDHGQQQDDRDLDAEQDQRGPQTRSDPLEGEEDHQAGGDEPDQPPRDVRVELGAERTLQIGADQANFSRRQERVRDEHQPAGDEAGARPEAACDVRVEGPGAREFARHLDDAGGGDQDRDQARQVDERRRLPAERHRELRVEERRDRRAHDRRGHDHGAGETNGVPAQARRGLRHRCSSCWQA
jgi:hypothetical protein